MKPPKNAPHIPLDDSFLLMERDAKVSAASAGCAAGPNGGPDVFIGCGPGTTSHLVALSAILLHHGPDLDELGERGAKFDHRCVVAEKGGPERAGGGNAFIPDWSMFFVNSPAETAPLNDGPCGPQGPLNYIPRLRKWFNDHRSAIAEEMRDYSIYHAIATDPSRSDDFRMPRAQAGAEEAWTFNRQIKQVCARHPWFKLWLLTNTEAMPDLSHPDRLGVRFRDPDSGKLLGQLTAASVNLNVGTPSCSPFDKPLQRVLCAMPGRRHAVQRDFLKSHDLLTAQGKLRAGATIGVGGLMLSAQEQVVGLVDAFYPVTPLERHGTGFRVTEAAEKIYQKPRITMVSRHLVNNPPRLVDLPGWTQKMPLLTDPREFHSLFVQGAEIFGAGYRLIVASTAVTLEMTPDTVMRRDCTTAMQLFKAQYHSTVKACTMEEAARHLPPGAKEAVLRQRAWSPEAALREGFLSLILNTVGEDVAQARKTIEAEFPLSAAFGYQAHEMAISALSELKSGQERGEKYAAFLELMRYVTAGSADLHEAITLLMGAGIVDHVLADYRPLTTEQPHRGIFTSGRTSRRKKPLTCDGQRLVKDPSGRPTVERVACELDAFLLSPPFNAEASPALTESMQYCEAAGEGPLSKTPRVDFLRRLFPKGSTQAMECRDNSIRGKGHQGLAAQYWARNNRETLVHQAAAMAYFAAAVIVARAIGLSEPAKAVARRFEALVPKQAPWQEEMDRLEPYFASVMLKDAIVRTAEIAAGNDANAYARIANLARQVDLEGKGRERLIAEMREQLNPPLDGACGPYSVEQERRASAFQTFMQALQGPAAFAPPSAAGYAGRSTCPSPEIARQVFEETLQDAKVMLQERAGSAVPAF